MSTVSLVTGGNRGIGREVCRQLAGRGHAVVLTARSTADGRAATRAPRGRARCRTPPARRHRPGQRRPRPRARSRGPLREARRPGQQRRHHLRHLAAGGRRRPGGGPGGGRDQPVRAVAAWSRSSCRCSGPAATRGSSTSPARPASLASMGGAPPPIPRRRRPSTRSPGCSPPNCVADRVPGERGLPRLGRRPTWAARAAVPSPTAREPHSAGQGEARGQVEHRSRG